MTVPNNPFIDIHALNGFNVHFTISTEDLVTVPEEDTGFIKGVKVKNERILWKDDLVHIPMRGWYQLRTLELIDSKGGHNVYRGLMMIRSESSIMLLPLLGGDRDSFSYTDHLMNAYCYHEDIKGQYLWVLMRPPKTRSSYSYDTTESLFRASHSFVKEEELGTEFKMFTFRIPSMYVGDYLMFLNSKFSRMSEIAKDKILNFHSMHDKSKLALQLCRDKGFRKSLEKQLSNKGSSVTISIDDELRSSLYNERETFKKEYIINESRRSIQEAIR